jgi:uncharacterized membrane protein YqiK
MDLTQYVPGPWLAIIIVAIMIIVFLLLLSAFLQPDQR